MPRPALRSRSLKRIKVRTPSGETVIHYERRKHFIPRCARCGSILSGVPRDPVDLRRLPKSMKRPERIFGGVLCHKCVEEILKSYIRSMVSQ
ncbi:MAG: 50S ribosomal protein L34e [Desulfurococcales archaeon]|jgi:large subunit ribosomal protein L34e|nr:50S ribosomal protein L34e [Desulfurococcales archaeon]NAZ13012.1 50S ribosomal protein L34e [Desulfurococcales archaeon]